MFLQERYHCTSKIDAEEEGIFILVWWIDVTEFLIIQMYNTIFMLEAAKKETFIIFH